jgi:hypothetical protein
VSAGRTPCSDCGRAYDSVRCATLTSSGTSEVRRPSRCEPQNVQPHSPHSKISVVLHSLLSVAKEVAHVARHSGQLAGRIGTTIARGECTFGAKPPSRAFDHVSGGLKGHRAMSGFTFGDAARWSDPNAAPRPPKVRRCVSCGWATCREPDSDDERGTIYSCSNKACEREERAA